jgi:hypothetical protein
MPGELFASAFYFCVVVKDGGKNETVTQAKC